MTLGVVQLRVLVYRLNDECALHNFPAFFSNPFPPLLMQMQRQREEAKERGKLEAELGKIRNLMEEKGHSHASAFEKRARQRAKPDQAAGLQKKRRI